MKKIGFVILGIILMLGLVSANYSLSNVVGIDIPSGTIAGSEFEANFSFDYFYNENNEGGSPLIIRLNISSDNENYPVWKGDFKIEGRIEKSWLFNILTRTIEFNCSEEYNQTIEHPLDAQNVIAPDGVFYCYNEDGDLELNERDEIYLNIIPDQAIYPGEYNFSAELFYLTDERAPFVNILNKEVFERYYRENDNVIIEANIFDGSEVVQKWGNAFLGYENLTIPFSHENEDIYYFSRNTPVDIIEDNYPLFVFAEDEYGNIGNDSVVLKIDRSAPEIVLIEPSGEVNGEILPIIVNVTDIKSGVNNLSIEYRLREMNGSSVCPEDGFGSWDCYNSGWLSLPWISGDSFGTWVNTTEIDLNGEYWLEIRAEDILGNIGVLE